MLTLKLSRVSAIAVAVAALSAGSAMAAETLYGGGATFPAQPYVGNDYLGQTPNARLSTNAGNTAGTGYSTATLGTGSVFLTYSNNSSNKVSYCQTGSGFGKNTQAGSKPTNQPCKDFGTITSPTSPDGLSGASAAAAPDFIGTDAPYSTADYNAFLNGGNAASRVGIVQVPTLAGAIALPQSTANASLNLTSAQICQIYSGQVSDWSNVSGSGATGPITVAFRTDGSGTSFAFTSYLARTCNGTSNVPTNFTFTPNQSFNAALPGGVVSVYGGDRAAPHDSSTYNANGRGFGASGNNGVVSAVRDSRNNKALGYADIGEVLLQQASYATVDGYDPKAFGKDSSGNPAPVSLTVANLLSGRVLDGATVNAVPGSGSTAVKSCVRLVNPSAAITNAYPIAAVTYLAGFTSGNGSSAHIQAVKDLFNIFYTSTTRPALPTGFAYLDGVPAFRTSVQNTISNCVQ